MCHRMAQSVQKKILSCQPFARVSSPFTICSRKLHGTWRRLICLQWTERASTDDGVRATFWRGGSGDLWPQVTHFGRRSPFLPSFHYWRIRSKKSVWCGRFPRGDRVCDLECLDCFSNRGLFSSIGNRLPTRVEASCCKMVATQTVA